MKSILKAILLSLTLLLAIAPLHAQTLLCHDQGTQLLSGQSLPSGACLRSPNGRYALILEPGGNLVLYDLLPFTSLWSSGTGGDSVSYATIDNNGNLDLYGPSQNLVSSLSFGRGVGSYLFTVQDDGTLVDYKQIWNTNSHTVENNPPIQPQCTLVAKLGYLQHLNAGSCVISNSTLFKINMQTDGNLVITNLLTQNEVWATNTTGLSVSYAVVQQGGQLQLVSPTGNVVWSSHTVLAIPGQNFSLMQDDGTFAIYQITWSSQTSAPLPALLGGGNLDQQTPWKNCTSGCAPYPPTTLAWPLPQNQVSPSLDGAAIQSFQKRTDSHFWGILYYFTHHMTTPELPLTNYSVEWSFQVDAPAGVQALEFDFPVVLNNLKYYFGTQCVRGGKWQYWDPNVSHWMNTSLACSSLTTGWHTLRWLGTRTETQFTYWKLEIDGDLYNINIPVNAPNRHNGDPSNGTITIQFQPDGRPNTAFHEYIDRVNAWAW